MKENMAIVDKKTVQELADHIDMIITNIIPNLDTTKNEIYNLTNRLYDLDKIVNDKNFSADELINSLLALQNEVQENLKYSKNITEQSKTYYDNMQLSLNYKLTNLNKKIAQTLTEAVEDLPLEKLNIEVLNKIEFAFVHFDALKRNLTNLQKELEHMQKYSKGILDDVENATIRFNRLNDKISDRISKINMFFAGVAGIIFAFLLQNYEFFLDLSTHIRMADWQGFLIFCSFVFNAGVGIYFAWKIVNNIAKEKEKEEYIV